MRPNFKTVDANSTKKNIVLNFAMNFQFDYD